MHEQKTPITQEQIANYECALLDCLSDMTQSALAFEPKIEIALHLLTTLATRRNPQVDYSAKHYERNSMIKMLDFADIQFMGEEERAVYYLSAMRQLQAYQSVIKSIKVLSNIESYESAFREYQFIQAEKEYEEF